MSKPKIPHRVRKYLQTASLIEKFWTVKMIKKLINRLQRFVSGEVKDQDPIPKLKQPPGQPAWPLKDTPEPAPADYLTDKPPVRDEYLEGILKGTHKPQ